METNLIRFSDNGQSTTDLFFIDGVFQSYVIEDEFRDVKIKSETRIPAGRYEIKLRTYGKWNERMMKHPDYRIRKIHRGMLQVIDVKNFDGILFHPGNTDLDTSGCLLPGNNIDNNRIGRGRVTNSTDAYIDIYTKVIAGFDRGEQVFINVHDVDRYFQQYFHTIIH